MDVLDRLRLGLGLAGAVPGTTIELRCRSGKLMRVSDGALDAPVDLAGLRQAVITAPDLVRGPIDAGGPGAVAVGGGLQDIGGGLYQRQAGDGLECWFATFLGPQHIVEIMAELDVATAEAVPEDITYAVGTDVELGVSVLRMQRPSPCPARLTAAAYQLLAATLVAELLESCTA